MKKWQLILVAVMLVAVGFWAALKHVKTELPDYGPVSAFHFQDQNGQDFSDEQLENKVWVAGFIFTRCMGPCPMISAKMAELKKRLHYSSRFALVSFSVDPEYDTPERLAEYAEKFKREGKPRWTFLTGDKEKIYRLAVQTFKQAASEDVSENDIQQRFMHGTRVVLVDSRGHIRGFYDSQDPKMADTLERDIRAIL